MTDVVGRWALTVHTQVAALTSALPAPAVRQGLLALPSSFSAYGYSPALVDLLNHPYSDMSAYLWVMWVHC